MPNVVRWVTPLHIYPLISTPRGDRGAKERNDDIKKNPGRLFLDLIFDVEPVFEALRKKLS